MQVQNEKDAQTRLKDIEEGERAASLKVEELTAGACTVLCRAVECEACAPAAVVA